MTRCYYCGTLLADAHAVTCPKCGIKLENAEATLGNIDWHPIAQFSYVAEAGYFADLLQSRDIDARVEYRQRLSMAEGPWETLFELQVPRAKRHLALNILREALAAEEGEDEERAAESFTARGRMRTGSGAATLRTTGKVRDAFSREQDAWARRWDTYDETPSFPTAKWLLLALLLGAGGYWLGRSGPAPYTSTTTEQSFWKTVVESAPWKADPKNGQPRRALRFDPVRRMLILEEDRDGDGNWDTVQGAVVVPDAMQ